MRITSGRRTRTLTTHDKNAKNVNSLCGEVATIRDR